MAVTDPWIGRLETASAARIAGSGDDLAVLIADPVARAGTWALMVLIAFMVFVMVVKPLA